MSLVIFALLPITLDAKKIEGRIKADYLHTLGSAGHNALADNYSYWAMELGSQLRYNFHSPFFVQGDIYIGFERRYKSETYGDDPFDSSYEQSEPWTSFILGVNSMIGISGRNSSIPLLRHLEFSTGPDIHCRPFDPVVHFFTSIIPHEHVYTPVNVAWRFAFGVNFSRYSINFGYDVTLTNTVRKKFFNHRGLDTIRLGVAYAF
ncbi:MAG: hypothetical protein K2M04_06650 [Muribaculaceae bacterium]|nr:hypothetical protein [Muribaculaceae bacterium]